MNEISSIITNIAKMNFINETKIFNEIQNNKKILILDLRSKNDFKNMSLPNSMNLPFDENQDDFFENFINYINPDLTDDPIIKGMLCKFRRYYIAIIFSEEKFHRKNIIDLPDEKVRSNDSLYKSLLLYNSLATNKVRELGVYLKGFKQLYFKYFFIVRNNLNDPLFK